MLNAKRKRKKTEFYGGLEEWYESPDAPKPINTKYEDQNDEACKAIKQEGEEEFENTLPDEHIEEEYDILAKMKDTCILLESFHIVNLYLISQLRNLISHVPAGIDNIEEIALTACTIENNINIGLTKVKDLRYLLDHVEDNSHEEDVAEGPVLCVTPCGSLGTVTSFSNLKDANNEDGPNMTLETTFITPSSSPKLTMS